MDLETTIAAAVVAAIVLAVSILAQKRKRRHLGDVSIIPWIGIQFVSLTALLLLAAHLLALLSGQDLGRRPF